MFQITVEIEGQDPVTHTFEKHSIIIGRSTGTDIPIDAPGVSRYHARISLEEGHVLIHDLDSTNGTFVDDEKVTSTILKPGSAVGIGDAQLSVRYDDPDSEGTDGSELFDDELEDTAALRADDDEILESEVVIPSGVDESTITKGGDFYWQSLSSFLAPVWSYINDESVSEIMINGPEEIYIERGGKLSRSNAKFTNDQLSAAVLNIAQYVGRRISEQEPYLDARLPDGSRVAVLSPPCSRKGISVAIRKFSKEKLTVEKLLDFGSFSEDMLTFLRACVLLKKNIIVSGGTSSGKTSLLNVVSSLVPADERIITIEDSAELQLTQDHVLPMESRPPDKKGRGEMTIRDLLKASLRMRPDRIIVGEIRSGEALDLLQAMNTGHSGSKATVHASSPPQALTRLETLSLFSGIEIPMRALREQVSSAIDYVIQASRLPDHSRKVTHISEVMPLKEDGRYEVNDVFRFQHTKSVDGKIQGTHIQTDYVPSMLDEMKIAGLEEAVALFEK